MIQNLVLKWLRWRYGGDRHALKPPLGYNRHQRRSIAYKAAYWLKRGVWEVERRLFDRYGAPMRENWERAFPPQALDDATFEVMRRLQDEQWREAAWGQIKNLDAESRAIPQYQVAPFKCVLPVTQAILDDSSISLPGFIVGQRRTVPETPQQYAARRIEEIDDDIARLESEREELLKR